jgi:hypothetical protein
MTKHDADTMPVTLTPDPLLAEWLTTADLNSVQHRELTSLGVTQEAMHRCGGLGWARVSTTGRLYMPSDTGDVSIIQPVWAGLAPSIYQGVEHPELADLLAWPLAEPGEWFYREGTPGAALGQEYLDAAQFDGEPVVLFLTPLDWLRANCKGAVLLEQAEGFWAAQREVDQAEATEAWWRGDAA